MKEVRDIKLDLLFGNDNEIINLFNEITDGIEIVNTNVYNEDGLEFIYHKDGKWIFFQDVKNGKFWCSNARYWTLFTSKFDLSYEEIQSITKFLVEEALKKEVSTPQISFGLGIVWVEEALKNEVNTPQSLKGFVASMVDEALKRDMDTPIDYRPRGGISVEVALEKKIGTPTNAVYSKRKKVDEALKQELSTPTYADGTVNVDLEEVLKREVNTQSITYVYKKTHIEEALKQTLEFINPDVFPKCYHYHL